MLENIRLSFQGVWSHRLRSFLTMLGIIIGIAAIIAIVSTIKGTNEQIKKNLIGSGTNTTTVQLTEEGNYPAEMEYGIPKGIPVLDDDMRQQLADIDHVKDASLYVPVHRLTTFTIMIHHFQADSLSEQIPIILGLVDIL